MERGHHYVEMAATPIEERYVRFHDETSQQFIARLRGELGPYYTTRTHYPEFLWHDLHKGVQTIPKGECELQELRITYRGLIEILAQDRKQKAKEAGKNRVPSKVALLTVSF